MGFLRHMGVRARMMVVILVAMLPLATMICVGLFVSYGDAEREAGRNAASEAKLGAARMSRLFDEAREFLSTIRHMPLIVDVDALPCNSLLAGLKAERPQFMTIGVIDVQGTIICHSKAAVGKVFGDHRLTQRVVAARGPQFVVGDFMIGAVTKKPTVAVAMRLPPRTDGRPAGAVFASLNLEVMENVIQELAGDTGHAAMIVQPASGRVVARWPHGVPFGSVFADHPLIEALRRDFDGGTVETIDIDGDPRVFGFQPIAGARTAGLMLAIGAPPEEVFGKVRSRSLWALGLSALALLTAALTTAWLAYWTQWRPISRLTRSAQQIGEGNFDTKTTMERWQAPEFRRLGQIVDSAARTLAQAQEAEQAVAASERRFRLLADNTADMISCIGLDGRRTLVTGASRAILGYDPDELIGLSPVELAVPEDRPQVQDMLKRTLLGQSVHGLRYRVRRRDGDIAWVEVSGQQITDGSGLVFTMRDVNERQRVDDELAEANRRLEHLAATDELTRLANRRAFNRALRDEIARSRRESGRLALLLIDVDRFKAFNDRYGHPAGDACLISIAQALGATLRPDEIGARYGGEELAVILPGADLTTALRRAEAIRRAVHTLAIEHEGSEAGHVTISIGVGTLSEAAASDDEADLLRRADEALYAAKSGGRDQVRCKAA